MRGFFAEGFLLPRTFGCAVNQKEFNEKYELLDSDEQKRLKRVAIRLWMVFQLRYRFQYDKNPTLGGQDWLRVAYTEKPSLEIYLLATCLDTLAGKSSGYKDFSDWLEEQKISENLSVAKVLTLFDCWRQEYGVSRALKALFDGLPQTVITWLSSYIKFERYTGTSTLNRKLFKYIFDEWRNPFTHESVTNDAWGDMDVELPSDENRWWSSSPDGYLVCRDGLDVATILRVIVYVVVLTRMGFEITTEHLDTYVKALSKLDAFYKFKWEMYNNISTLRLWKNYDGLPMPLYELGLSQVHRLNDKLKSSPLPMERGLSEILTAYEDNLKLINDQIIDFKATYTYEPHDISSAYYGKLYDFIAQLVTTEAFRELSRIYQNNRIKSIDFFIREVFLYWPAG